MKSQENAPWHLRAICDEDEDYVYKKTGKGVSIYVMDSGVQTNHEEFDDRATTLYSYDESDYSEDNPHGTSVASCAAGKTYGVAKEANIYSLRFDMSQDDAVRAVDKVLEHQGKSPSVLVKSFGGPSPLYDNELKKLEENGVIVVAAAGNDNADLSENKMFPAKRKRTIAVGSVNKYMRLSNFSNFGKPVDILAPGSSIPCATVDGYTKMHGTSFACPIVAGVIAQMVEGERVRDEQDVAEVRERLVDRAFSGDVDLVSHRKTPNKFVRAV